MVTPTPRAPLSSDKQLSGNLGTASICFMVIAAAAPLTVVGGPMTLGFVFGNGATLPTVYVVTGLVLICFAAAFTAMTPYVKSAGAFYSYIHKGLGRRVGIAAGYTALITYGALYLGVYALFGTGLRSLVESFGGPSIPWWLCAIAGLLLVGFLGYRNIEISGRILAVLLIAEIAIVIILDAVIFSHQSGVAEMPTEFLNPLEVFSSSAGNAFIFTVLSFIGIEATAVFRSETKNPEKTVPRALYISLFCVAIFYGLTSWSLVFATGENSITEVTSADPEGYLPAVSLQYLGTVGQHIVAVLFVTSILAAAITFHNVVARYLFTLGSEKLMPGTLATTHPKHGSPSYASTWTTGSVAVGLLLTVVLRLDPMAEMYTWTAGLASLGYVWLLLGTSVAVVVFLLSVMRRGGRIRRWPVIAAFVASLGLLVIFWLMLTNLGLLVGESAGVAWVILSLLVLPLIIGPMTGKLRPEAARGESSPPLPDTTDGISCSLPERDTT